MNTKLAVACLLAVSCLASGCASLSPVSTQNLPQQVTLSKQTPFVSTWRSSEWNPSARYAIGSIQWDMPESGTATAEDKRLLEAALTQALRKRVGAVLRVGAPVEGDLMIRPTITGVNPSSPAANVALSLLIGPVDTGGASVQFELVDPTTNEQRGVLVSAKNGRLFSNKGFKRWGHAEQAFDAAATALAEFIANAPGSDGGTDAR